MLKGFIRNHGKKAITIQTEAGNQYYGPMENIKDEQIFDCLANNFCFIPVKFSLDTTKFSGTTRYGKRYYAYDIEFDMII